jgi:hypothetical protein
MDKVFTVFILGDGDSFSLNSTDDDVLKKSLEFELSMRGKDKDAIIKTIRMTDDEHATFSWALDEKLEPIYNVSNKTGISEKTESSMDKMMSTTHSINAAKETYFNILDIAFQKALEEEDPQLLIKKKKSVIEKKHFLRNIPKTLDEWLELYSENKFLNFEEITPFGNIFDIEITNKGSGYRSAPHVTITPPGREDGATAQAQASVLNGEIDIISVINHGQGYTKIPDLTISPPEDADGVAAEAKVTSISNSIEFDIGN